ncbi:MAG: alpha-L-fucosidase [Limisphaerales bacterium]
MNNRLGPGFRGDTETPEQKIPVQGYKNRDWETCMTINDTWGYKRDDHRWKSTETLIRNLCDIVSKGGNYLLNVGPTSEGVIPAPEIERLNEVGAWMKVNSEAIYGSTASPFPKQLNWGRCTQKDGKLYFEVFDWPADGKLLVPLLNEGKAWLLASPHKKLKCTVESVGLTIQVPANAPDKIASVIVFQPEDKLQLLPEKTFSGRENSPIFCRRPVRKLLVQRRGWKELESKTLDTGRTQTISCAGRWRRQSPVILT